MVGLDSDLAAEVCGTSWVGTLLNSHIKEVLIWLTADPEQESYAQRGASPERRQPQNRSRSGQRLPKMTDTKHDGPQETERCHDPARTE